jgi:YbbR domain-containing protein
LATNTSEEKTWYQTKKFWGSLFLAIALWIYASLNDEYQTIIDIPITVSAPEDRALETVLPNIISVDASGSGWNLFYNSYLNKLKKCYINLESVKKTDSSYIISRVDMQKGLINFNKTTPQRFYPDEFVIKTGEISNKDVEIIPDVDIDLKNGFVLVGNVKSETQYVNISGNVNLIDSIKSWKTQKIKLDEVNSSFSQLVSVSDSLNSVVKIHPNKILIYGNIQQYSEQTFDDIPLEIIGGQLPQNYNISPKFFSVTLTGGIDILNKIRPDDISAVIEYDTIMANNTGILKPILNIPPFTKVLNTEPNYLRYNIIKRD